MALSMLVLHLASTADRLLLWGEAPPESGDRRQATDKRPHTRRGATRASASHAEPVATPLPRRSPFDASRDDLRAVAASVSTTRRGTTDTATAWLPTVGGNPVASTALVAEPPPDSSSATLAPWIVTTCVLPLDEALELIARCADARMLGPGVLVGADLAFWAEALRFAASLVAREQFLPSIEPFRPPGDSPGRRQRVTRRARPARRSTASLDEQESAGAGERWRARWIPVIPSEDAKRFHALVERMPDACRALSIRPATGDSSDPRSTSSFDPDLLVRRFVGDIVDLLVRAAGADRADPHARGVAGRAAADRFDSLHAQWLAALRSADGAMVGDRNELARLADHIREWQRPVALADAAPFRLAFRLHEPSQEESATGDDRPPRALARPGAGAIEAGTHAAWRVEYLLQSVRDPSLLVPASDVWADGRRARALLGQDFDAHTYLLGALGQAAALGAAIDASLHAPEPEGFETDTEGAFEFLTGTAWTLEQAGYAVMLPAWWTRKGARVRLGLRAHVRDSMKAPTGLSLDTVLAVDWEAALGDDTLSLAELERLARFKTPLVRVRGQWVQVTAEDRQRAIEFLKRQQAARLSARELVRLALLGTGSEGPAGMTVAGVQAEGWFRDVLARLENHAPFEELQPPEGFNGTLRPYQARGYSWLALLAAWGAGSCLADDMGLGKTIQALALVLRDWTTGDRRGPVLLVCPTSVVGNWQKEAARFTPDLPVLVHHGQARTKDASFAAQVAGQALVISSYALLHRDAERLASVRWAGVMLDEAQNIKNPETKQARAARALEAGYRIALTGTPVENNVGDLWSIMEFLNPGFLGPLATFRRRFLLPIQTGTDLQAAEQLKRLTGPFVLRRMKTDRSIIADLPEKQEMKVFCTLTREQASLYGAVVKDAERALRASEGIARKGVVLATLSKLKQVCNHPAQFLGEGGPLPHRSGKLARLTEMLEEAAGTGDRALVFSQFAEMGELLKRHLEATFGREVPFLHGGVPKDQRDRMVERFQSREGDAFVFVLSLKAGGTGLNLTAANHVFLFDRWWNPAVENQAIDRTFRIGQTRDVQVHKFLCAGTLEERIDEMLERKLAVASRVVGTGEGWLTELSTEELRQVFALREEAMAE